MGQFDGKFYWPSEEYSTPADNHCWHVPPSPNADFKCIRRVGHPGKHHYEWSPNIHNYSHKDVATMREDGLSEAEIADNLKLLDTN